MVKNFLNKYNEEINNLWNDVLKEEIIKSFVKFYGKEHEYKIKNIIDNLVIIRVERDLGKMKFKEKSAQFLEKMKESAKNFLNELNISYVDNDNFISKCEDLAKKDIKWFESLVSEVNVHINIEDFLLFKRYFYMYKYYKELETINFNTKFNIIGRNVDTDDYDSLLDLNIDDGEKGAAYPKIRGF